MLALSPVVIEPIPEGILISETKLTRPLTQY